MTDIRKRLQFIVNKYNLKRNDLPHPSSLSGKSDRSILTILREIGKAKLKENQDVKNKEVDRKSNKKLTLKEI